MAITRNDIIQYTPAADTLSNRVILITGAGDGIGRAVAEDCAAKGATVVLLGKTVGKLEAVYDSIVNQGGPQPAIYPMDLRHATWDDYQHLAATIKSELGQLNGMVINAASVPSLMPFQQITPQLYQEIMTVNLHAPFLMIQTCLPLLRESTDPAIVMSTHTTNRAYWGSFGIAKAGLVGMLDILAHELDVADRPVRVNGVDTGPVFTNLRQAIYPAEVASDVPQPADITAPYLYFLSEDSRGTTGINLKMDTDS